MRLLYVYKDVSNQSGVFNKILGHINSLAASYNDINIEVLIYGEHINREVYSSFNVSVRFVKIGVYNANSILRKRPFWGVLYEKELWNTYEVLIDQINTIKPEIMVMRDFAMSRSGLKFLRQLSLITDVVLESNTLIRTELELKAQKNQWSFVEYKKEKRWRQKVSEEIQGVIAVTNELANQYRALGFSDDFIHIYSNGILVGDKKMTEYPTLEKIKGVFLAGTGSNWNGIERLIRSLECYVGEKPVQIDVFGVSCDDIQFGNKVKISFLPTLNAKELNSAMNDYHFGVSTLALYLKQMKEASALKVRTYLANGLPIILAYKDTDIPEELPYVFSVSNNDSLVDFEKAIEYFDAVWKREMKIEINDFAKKNLDFKLKQKELVSYLYRINKRSENPKRTS